MSRNLILSCLILAVPCSAFLFRVSPQPLFGKWQETWGIGHKTDVTYHDEFIIKPVTGDPGFSISCPARHYGFRDLRFNGQVLSFVKKKRLLPVALSPEIKPRRENNDGNGSQYPRQNGEYPLGKNPLNRLFC